MFATEDPATPGTPEDGGPEPSRVRPDDPTAEAVRAAPAYGLHGLGVTPPPACAGDPGGVHHLRTTTRRLRSALDLFRPLTDPAWNERLAAELKWLGGALGAV